MVCENGEISSFELVTKNALSTSKLPVTLLRRCYIFVVRCSISLRKRILVFPRNFMFVVGLLQLDLLKRLL